MPNEFDIQYALEMTKVIYEPDRRIDTFGSTRFDFQIVTEVMDQAGVTRVREGSIDAEKPMILRPDMNLMASFEFDGFGSGAEQFGEFLKQHLHRLAIVKYGFRFVKNDMSEHIVHEPGELVANKLAERARAEGKPSLAVLTGADDVWEISLLKFTVEMIEKSQRINWFDFKRKGLLG
jgi:hypothetical protein